jgi:hypothetical protein
LCDGGVGWTGAAGGRYELAMRGASAAGGAAVVEGEPSHPVKIPAAARTAAIAFLFMVSRFAENSTISFSLCKHNSPFIYRGT